MDDMDDKRISLDKQLRKNTQHTAFTNLRL